MKFIKKLEDEDGNVIDTVEMEVKNDVQASALINDGWKEVKEPKTKAK